MNLPPTLRATDGLFWGATLAAALMDAVLVALLAWRIPTDLFRLLGRALWGISTLFWFILWAVVLREFWGLAYRYIFPEWGRWAAPPFYGLLFGAVGLGLWWLALRLPGNPVASFCLLGGLVSLPGHCWAIFGLGMLHRVPLLQQISPASALVFGIFEFIVYWSVILGIAALLYCGWGWGRRVRSRRPKVT